MKRTWILLVAALLPACSDGPAGPGPGTTPAGQSCAGPAQCGCWECTCKGVSGPGGAQHCTDGHCPSGEDVCAGVCALVSAKVAKATPVDHCPGTL